MYNPKVANPNQRVTMAGSTTIARVYHSVALLLTDGRVWIAGSNPKGKYSLIQHFQVANTRPNFELSFIHRLILLEILLGPNFNQWILI
jgi:hypothetical protein